ncbi:colibactin polyketide synthase ClbO [Gilliamella sp. App4-10]|uniref:colibactin polyketide synthase ClbO n=1 Tax=Gilliamella sp. App4-10 TaxID=3120231 RepID=UPI00080DFDB1|nr:colibactin polyketide synthase ClbO [Gilliamella apicola]OCG21788.1 polyketide synthase [Gilliamella apicola]
MIKNEFSCDALDIAIIGMSGRFAGAESVTQWWKALLAGEELTKPKIVKNQHKEPWISLRNMISDPYDFDAAFFNIPPGEAILMDPQHRVFLECCYNALEHSGYVPGRIKRVGVYGTTYANSYLMDRVYPYLKASQDKRYLQTQIGNEKDYLSSFVAYKLGLNGPAVSVQTACSSSLMATQLACDGLITFQADMALAGGVTLGFLQESGYSPTGDKLMSQTGHCAAFSADSTGTVYSSGVGVVVLKRLEDALRDEDTVYAVIKGGAANNDGSRRVGFVAPSVEGQTEVIKMALNAAEISPTDITMIETHGTGTPLGDEIELDALHKVFAAECAPHSIQISSVKANIGHLGVASGIASLIKTSLALYTQKIPAQINLQRKHKMLLQPNTPFYISNCITLLPPEQKQLVAVSSFGLGGTNVQLIIQNWPTNPPEKSPAQERYIFPFSAKSALSLNRLLKVYIEELDNYREEDIARIAYTLNERRAHFTYRCAIVAHSLDKLREQLVLKQNIAGTITLNAEKKVILLFSAYDQALKNNMIHLMSHQPALKQHHDQLVAKIDLLWPTTTWTIQLRHFIYQASLAKWLIDQGIIPDDALGNQAGKITADYISHTITLEEVILQLKNLPVTSESVPLIDDVLRVKLEEIALSPGVIMIEIGTPSEFSALYQQNSGWIGKDILCTVFNQTMSQDIYSLLATLWQFGIVSRLPTPEAGSTIGLPGYQFDRIRYEIQSDVENQHGTLLVSYTSVEDFVKKMWCTLLCIDKYSEKETIFEYGATSLHIISFINRCNFIYKTALTANDIYAMPCIKDHTAYIAQCVDNIL